MARFTRVPLLKRRRSGLTDYVKRKALILGGLPFVTPRITSRNVSVQVSLATRRGDEVIASAHSRELLRYGWKVSRKALPAAYLTGLLAGLRARREGVEKAIPYMGVIHFVAGSRVASVMEGMIDAGVEVPCDRESLPSPERIAGEHIATYAKSLLESNRQAYESLFSGLLREGIPPEGYPSHCQEVKLKILKEFGVKLGE